MPSLQKRLPKPGAWMDRLKQGLAFPMYAAAVWLVWVLAQQAGVNAVAVALAGWSSSRLQPGYTNPQNCREVHTTERTSVAGFSLWLA